VTLARDTLCEADALFEALAHLDRQILFCFPNADAGSRELARRAQVFCEAREAAAVFVNLAPAAYWSLLSRVALVLGNSSSGIMESPSFAVPCVNVGLRQRGRQRAANIVDVEPTAAAIAAGLAHAASPEFRRSLRGMVNPYGDGHAAGRIVRVLVETTLGARLLLKQASG
jgi:UDP-N-acetylglucosamine 2-epimerase (non-hydrolysing)/GDP/UDP-N,N'-diacetylbacillosamine 2-epimerase (hydrolysing)